MNKEILGNSLEYLKTLNDESIDLILTDPPYNTTDCKWDKKIEWSEWWFEWKRIIKKTGSIVITCQMPFLADIVLDGLDIYRHRWVWKKDKCGNFLVAKGQPLKYTEDVLVFSKMKYLKVHNSKKEISIYNPQMRDGTGIVRGMNGERSGLSAKQIQNRGGNTYLKSNPKTDGVKRYPQDLLFFNVPQKKQERIHPTQKPVLLFEYLIKTYTNEGMTVLDCFAGSMTTAISCLNTNRKYICIEQEEEMYNKAKDRIKKWHDDKESRLF